MIAWSLFAFGGVYLWAVWPLVAAAGLLAVLVRPTVASSADLRRLDWLIVLTLAWCGFVLVPLPWAVLNVVSPRLAEVVNQLSLERGTYHALTIDPAASLHAGLVVFVTALTFWSLRSVFSRGGIRTVARAVALCGLAAAVVGILQDASRTRLVYWRWMPLTDGPAGFGPFINRNHFATWTVMALSLTTGYLFARTDAGDEGDRFRSFIARLRRRLDFRSLWLLGSLVLMATALLLTLSRSGLAAAAVALILGRVMAPHQDAARRRWIYGVAAVLVMFGILWTGPTTLAGRWETAEIGQKGRSVIWRETTPVVRDFWITGTGTGTFGSAMSVYQQSDRTVHFNQAHNQYLQVMAEGGIVLSLLAALTALMFIYAAVERIRRDRTGMGWMRIGAAAGLAGVAVQSIWETGARMPANAILAAALAAIVLHEPEHRHSALPDHGTTA